MINQTNEQIQIINLKKRKQNKKLFSQIGVVLSVFFIFVTLTLANMYSNTQSRKITDLNHQIQQAEDKLEKEKIINQSYSSKQSLESNAKNKSSMHYSANNVVVSNFND